RRLCARVRGDDRALPGASARERAREQSARDACLRRRLRGVPEGDGDPPRRLPRVRRAPARAGRLQAGAPEIGARGAAADLGGGSHGLPGWVWLAREAMEAGRLGAVDLRELMEDATQAALLDQERAGIDVVTTGEMMRVRFIVGFYDFIQGIRPLEPPRKLGQPLWDTNTPFEVVGKVSAPHGLGIVDEFKLARSLTTRRIKATVPGPYTLLVPLKLGGGYKDKDTLLADLVQIVNAECRALVAVGADFIQIDEPHSGMYAGSVPQF